MNNCKPLVKDIEKSCIFVNELREKLTFLQTSLLFTTQKYPYVCVLESQENNVCFFVVGKVVKFFPLPWSHSSILWYLEIAARALLSLVFLNCR